MDFQILSSQFTKVDKMISNLSDMILKIINKNIFFIIRVFLLNTWITML
jgi:glycerol-3-phosphate responsive antiterminator